MRPAAAPAAAGGRHLLHRLDPRQHVPNGRLRQTGEGPSGARRRVSYPVSDSMSCRRHARVPVSRALPVRIKPPSHGEHDRAHADQCEHHVVTEHPRHDRERRAQDKGRP